MLGARGEGFKIAMNALNVGRIKLGIAVTGAAKKQLIMPLDTQMKENSLKYPLPLLEPFNTNWQKWPQKPTWQMPVIIEQDKT